MNIDLLRKISINDVLWLEENFDEQYKALEYLFKNLKDVELFFRLSILNSLNSFQLSMTGEKYWWAFSKYFSENKPKELFEDFKEFLKKYNRRFLGIKLKRVEKARPFIKKLSVREIKRYAKDLVRFTEDLAKTMGQKRNDKTIVFSAKIFGYCYRISFKEKLIFPFEIDIPLDLRIRKINPDINFWRGLSRELNIPPLHLDSIFWIKDAIRILSSRIEQKEI